MAWHFDEQTGATGQHVQVTDDAALTLPDADWTMAGRVRLDDNVGTLFQYFLSWGAFSASPSCNWFFGETSEGTGAADKLRILIEDSGGDTYGPPSGGVTSTGTPGTSTVWQHLALVRSGNTLTQYVDGVADGTATNVNVDAINVAGNLYFGMRSDNDANRRLGGSMAEWARALGADELTAAASGFSPLVMPKDIAWYLPMFGGQYVERINNLTVTPQNTPGSADHPRMIYPGSGLVIPAVVAAAGNRRRRMILFGAGA